MRLDDERLPVKPGDVIVIPGGVFHSIENRDCVEPSTLLTVWARQELNETYFARLRAWGRSLKFLDPNYLQKRG